MAVEYLGNWKGPRGVQGKRGARGLPGVNAVENDAAVAAYLAAEDSASGRELARRVGQVALSTADFGAEPDSGIDATPAIQAAIDAAGPGKSVILAPGNYAIGGRLRLRNVTQLHGYGATLTRTQYAGLPTEGLMVVNWDEGDYTTTGYNGHSDIGVYGITFDFAGDTIEHAGNTVTFNHARNITVRDCTFRRGRGYHDLELNSTDGALIDNCTFAGFVETAGLPGKEAIQIDVAQYGDDDSGAKDGTMAKNITVRKCTFTSYGELPGAPTGVGSHARDGGKQYEGITITDCVFTGGTGRAVDGWYWSKSSVTGNTVSGYTQGIRLVDSHDSAVNGNQISSVVSQGVSLGTNSTGVAVVGNTISDCAAGVFIGDGGRGNTVSGNTTVRTSSYAAIVEGADETLISGNTFRSPGYPAGAFGAVRITSNASTSTSWGTSVTANKVITHGAGTEVSAGVSVVSDAQETWVFGNDFRGLAQATTGPVNTTSNRT
ncbi:hypothetical protein D9V30_00010 [Mycetocola reblochoni]|uniref:Right handed beta helix domain-containing protein n=1 Tax=Mycetocola reblochoni TaxID=331618 RepID=A0A3L6ZSK3_9MICO|nr:right-handed parallel beta-helix repeat-containing protein [Mycetocola reblochoni]RLP70857.1 hypothetical protein D9V30_00010 [Mycetocola reblochoni]